ncbi:MAG TPA: serine/threonine-protein kinase [Planctomycetota bacterium]|nr:serine/threonine-protein kinase [Planctomycetota bacterium]
MGTVPSSGKRKAAPGSGIHGTAAGGLLANLPTTQQFPPAAPGDRGTWFGGFHLIQELTIGGFGEVWIALDTATNKEVVIKRLKPEQAEFKRAFYQFDIEIEIGQRVKHPNLVPVLQHGIVDGRRFFTMPRITGPSLTRILNKRAGEEWTLSILEILAALEMIGRALGFLHRAGVVHCDLKPDNILFSARNRPMLIDLGIARTVNWAQSGYRALKAFREDDSILGTPEYMAPELFLGENEQIGFGVDLYAMGVILYEVLAGVTPFKRDSQQAGGDATKVLVELMDRVQTAAPPEVLELNPTAPPALAELAMQCLSKDPAGRPKSADDFAVAIGRVLRPVKTPTPKGKQGALTRLTKLIRKSDKPKS